MSDFFDKNKGNTVIDFAKMRIVDKELKFGVRLINGDLIEDQQIIFISDEIKYESTDTKISVDFANKEIIKLQDSFTRLPE
jgi:hypothetical protein